MLATLDYVVIVLYLLCVAALGIFMGGRQKNTTDYFLGGRDLPWWAVCFSVVATETSTLTVISVPAVAYGGTMTFLQLTLGYFAGRTLVSILLLPRYFRGSLVTAYAFLGARFGNRMRGVASITFLTTRLLADGVRLFATAIPIKVVADLAGLTLFDNPVTYFQIILVLGVITVIYTLIGGIRAVVWMDVVQMMLYVGGGVLALVVLMQSASAGWWTAAAVQGKTAILDLGWGLSLSEMVTQPYVFLSAVVGGTIFSMASHGTDQIIVQRLLTCRSLADGQKALIGSSVIVAAQFALFLFVGLLLWTYYGGVAPEALGLSRADELFPKFIIEGLPPGVSGLVLAGIIAAAMSTLSSSLNSLASSTMMDLYERIRKTTLEPRKALSISRGFTLFWAVVFVLFASLFRDTTNPVVELGLAIASFTYGGLLGVFLLGLWNKRAREMDAVLALLVSVAVMVLIVFGLWYSPQEGWVFVLGPDAETVTARGLQSIGWPWYTVIGTVVTLAVGSLLRFRHRDVGLRHATGEGLTR